MDNKLILQFCFEIILSFFCLIKSIVKKSEVDPKCIINEISTKIDKTLFPLITEYSYPNIILRFEGRNQKEAVVFNNIIHNYRNLNGVLIGFLTDKTGGGMPFSGNFLSENDYNNIKANEDFSILFTNKMGHNLEYINIYISTSITKFAVKPHFKYIIRFMPCSSIESNLFKSEDFCVQEIAQ